MFAKRAATMWLVILTIGTLLVLVNAIKAAQVSRDELSQQLLSHQLYDVQQAQFAHDRQIATNTEHLIDVDRRLVALENQDISSRLSKIETTMNENQAYLRSTVGGTILVLVGLAVQFVFTRRLHSRLSVQEEK